MSGDPDGHWDAPGSAARTPPGNPVLHPSADALPGSSGDPAFMEWRTGRRVGRTIYVVVAGDPDGDGWLIGVMDTRELATAAVDAHNQARGYQR